MHILHVFDGTTGWEQRQGVSQLLQRLPKDRYRQSLASVGGWPSGRLDPTEPKSAQPPVATGDSPGRVGNRCHTTRFVGYGWWRFLNYGRIRDWVSAQRVSLVHAWGPQAAEIMGTALQGSVPLAITLFDPRPADRHINFLRSLENLGRFAIACGAATVRRRLIERGVPMANCVVIRPGVDFAAINAARSRRASFRNSVGDPTLMVLTAEAEARDAGQEVALHAVSIRSYLDPRIRILVPGDSLSRNHWVRWVTASGQAETLVELPEDRPFEAVLPLADVLVLPVREEISTTAIAWAMASSVLVMAGAVYATSELLAHGQNALLMKPESDKRMAVKVAAMLGEVQSSNHLRETARGQAFEVFGIRRCVDQYTQLYENLVRGAPSAEGIVDSAAVG